MEKQTGSKAVAAEGLWLLRCDIDDCRLNPNFVEHSGCPQRAEPHQFHDLGFGEVHPRSGLFEGNEPVEVEHLCSQIRDGETSRA